LFFPVTVYRRLIPVYTVCAFVKVETVSSCKSYTTLEPEDPQLTGNVPVDDVAGTFSGVGAGGGMIWHPFPPAVQPL
jgi:hypothetical protein